jgi:hypothetical protein
VHIIAWLLTVVLSVAPMEGDAMGKKLGQKKEVCWQFFMFHVSSVSSVSSVYLFHAHFAKV